MRAVARAGLHAPRARRSAGSWPGPARTARARAPPRRRAGTCRSARRARRGAPGRGCTRTHASVMTPSVPSEPSSIRSGDGPAPEPGQPPRLPRAARRDRADALDEVVDVRELRREVPAGARRDPAAERRELERLREEAHRQAVRAEQLLDAAGRSRPRRCAPRARPRRARAARRARRGRATARRRSAPGSAARRRRRRSSRRRRGSTATFAPAAHSSSASTSRLVARARDEVRARARRRRGTRGRCRGRTCRRRASRASRCVLRADRARASPGGGATRGAGSVTAPSATGLLELAGGEAEQRGDPRRRLERLRGGERRVLEAPAPGAARAPRHRRPTVPCGSDDVGARHPRARTLVPRPGRGAAGRDEHFEPSPAATAAADAAVAALAERGSPSHDGLGARLVGPRASARTARLDDRPAARALVAAARRGRRVGLGRRAVRRARQRRAAGSPGRRAAWLASWPGRWALGAGGAVDVGENPVDTLVRELREEWAVAPERVQAEALVLLPHEMVMFVGQAWLPAGRRRSTLRPRARRLRLVAGRRRRVAGRGRRAAAAHGDASWVRAGREHRADRRDRARAVAEPVVHDAQAPVVHATRRSTSACSPSGSSPGSRARRWSSASRTGSAGSAWCC